MTKPTGKINPTYKLTPDERLDVARMVEISRTTRYPNRWSITAIAKAYNVARKTVTNCHKAYFPS